MIRLMKSIASVILMTFVAAGQKDCKSLCTDLRQPLLNDISNSPCKSAASIHPVPKLFQACIDGRKKGFEQCVLICNSEKLTDSFEGCKTVMNRGNVLPKMTDWCRRGYDSILSTLELALVQKSNSYKNDSFQDISGEDSEDQPVQESENIEATSSEEVSFIGGIEIIDEVDSDEKSFLEIEEDQNEPIIDDDSVQMETEETFVKADHGNLRNDGAATFEEEEDDEDNEF